MQEKKAAIEVASGWEWMGEQKKGERLVEGCHQMSHSRHGATNANARLSLQSKIIPAGYYGHKGRVHSLMGKHMLGM